MNYEPNRQRSSVDREALGLKPGLKPVRRIRPKSRRISRPGNFATVKTFARQPIRTEAVMEMDGLAHIEINPRYVRIAPQPHRLTYHVTKPDGSTRVATYVPDLAVLTIEGNVVIVDFKSRYLRGLPEWSEVEPVIREAYLIDHGAAFTVLTEEHFAIEPRRSNVAIMLMHRPPQKDAAAIAAVRGAIGRIGLPSTIGAIRSDSGLRSDGISDSAFSALVELAISGEVTMGMAKPFDDLTVIDVGPFA
ncbi:hypothetical protein [Methylobacterium sp. GC_Met_2]|uniref:hypothetical protein n=1 Tax=Methylobacterium sp. GC_Met_2 TaxID=2937376 RepID=UPI00226B8F5D|nr:hypothetical protein [Methylobacterium sp. GC_Met_2]